MSLDDDPDLARRLRAARPEPRSFFREELGRRVQAAEPVPGRPETLRLQVAAWAGTGVLALVIALLAS